MPTSPATAPSPVSLHWLQWESPLYWSITSEILVLLKKNQTVFFPVGVGKCVYVCVHEGCAGGTRMGGCSWQQGVLELTMPPLKTAAPPGVKRGTCGRHRGCSVLLAPPGTLSL